jgi:hypothetical protein
MANEQERNDSFETAESKEESLDLSIRSSPRRISPRPSSQLLRNLSMKEQHVVSRSYKHFLNSVAKAEVKIENPIDVLKSLWYVIDGFGNMSNEEKKKVLIAAIEDIAAGQDGILNTADDIIPNHVLRGIEIMIECDMITSTIDLICETTHIKTGITFSMYVFQIVSGILCCSCCRKRTKSSQQSEREPLLYKIAEIAS